MSNAPEAERAVPRGKRTWRGALIGRRRYKRLMRKLFGIDGRTWRA